MNKSASVVLLVFVLAVAVLITFLRIYERNTQALFSPQLQSLSPTAMASNSAMNKQEFKSITVSLTAINNSGQSGTAVIREVKEKVEIDISVSPINFSQQGAQIHLGLCQNPGQVKYVLQPIENGKSVTTLQTPFIEFMKQFPLSITVHKSNKDTSPLSACAQLQVSQPQ